MFGEFMVNNYDELMPMPTTEKFNELDQVMIDAAQEMFSEKGADVKTTLDAAVIKMQEVMNK